MSTLPNDEDQVKEALRSIRAARDELYGVSATDSNDGRAHGEDVEQRLLNTVVATSEDLSHDELLVLRAAALLPVRAIHAF